MASEADPSTGCPRRQSCWARLSLRMALVLIALAAFSSWGYRYWLFHYNVKVKSYPVGDLIPATRGDSFRPLIDEITTTVQPGSWSDRGSRSVTPFFLSSSLIVRTDDDAHREIAEILHQKRAKLASQAAGR